MPTFPRPVVIVSKCLELDACRYNAQKIRAPFVLSLAEHVDLRPICPEVEIGLGTPRDPIRLVSIGDRSALVQPSTGRDVTSGMVAFAREFLDGVPEADGFLLKSRSPSCGIKDTKVYGDVEARQPTGKGAGLFGAAVLERFPHAAVEDEGRLTNARIRHHFLVKLYLRAEFRDAALRGTTGALVAFQARHKLQLMAHNQAALRAAGRIVANGSRRPAGELFGEYEDQLTRALARPARDGANVNVLQHAMGYFWDRLSAR